jgi:NAD(P)H dehydrogenase (quinone)
MIVVTGATGELGHAIVVSLLKRIGPSRVGVSVRNPGKAGDLAALGVRVRQGDFDDSEGLVQAFEGAEQVLLVSSNARSYGGDTIAQHRAAIDAARAVGARRIVYTSHMAASRTSAFPPMLDHAETEAMLAAAGTAWTSLRNGFYASSGVALIGAALDTGVIEAPPDGKVSWTAHADLAEAAAIVLTDEGRFDGPTPPLTSSAALDLSGIAATASKLLGRTVERKVISDDTFREGLIGRGLPPTAVEIATGLYRASRAGEFATVDPTLAILLGRPPITMRDVLEKKMKS